MSDPETPRPSDSPHDATLHLKVGEPEDPSGTMKLERTDPGQSPGTVKIALGGDQTQKTALPPAPSWDSAPAAGAPIKPAPEADLAAPAPGRSWKMPLILGGVVVAGVAAYLAFAGMHATGSSQAPAQGRQPDAVPQSAKLYYEQAMAGDPHAMRMLGVMYYYGLNIPQDRAKGLYWYRKAAEQGSGAAREELRKLESGS